MKASEINVGDKVKCTNMWGTVYTVTEKFDKVCTLDLVTGDTIMYGGKEIPEVYTYCNIKYSSIKEIVKQ